MKKLTLWHTNDIHSHFENWPQIIAFLQAKREQADSSGEAALFFDIGDFLDRVHPLTEGTNGKANVAMLNELPYDAVTIGNNEGTTLAHEQVEELYEDAVFPVVCCNLYEDLDYQIRPDWAAPFVYKQIDDHKVAIIGATAPFREFYETLGWGIEEPIPAIQKVLAMLDKDTDTIILLSHLGLPTDERIAEVLPEIDIIIGSHTHHLLETGKMVGNTLLAAAGKWGQYVGEITITFHDDRTIAAKTAITYPTASLPDVAGKEIMIEQYFEEGKAELSAEVVQLPEALYHDWYQTSKIADIMAEAVIEWTGAETFLNNAGIFMKDWQPGTITEFDIHQMLPHPLNAIVVTMTGEELAVLIQSIAEKEAELVQLPLRGFGFRGEFFGKILMPGASFDAENQVALFHGEWIDAQKEYRIATHDTFVFAPFFPIIKRVSKKEVYTPELLRDILKWKLKAIYG